MDDSEAKNGALMRNFVRVYQASFFFVMSYLEAGRSVLRKGKVALRGPRSVGEVSKCTESTWGMKLRD